MTVETLGRVALVWRGDQDARTMMRRLGIDAADLPVIWDADFLYGPKTPAGEDTYVLYEINVSAVLPIPDEAPAEIARCVARRLARA